MADETLQQVVFKLIQRVNRLTKRVAELEREQDEARASLEEQAEELAAVRGRVRFIREDCYE